MNDPQVTTPPTNTAGIAYAKDELGAMERVRVERLESFTVLLRSLLVEAARHIAGTSERTPLVESLLERIDRAVPGLGAGSLCICARGTDGVLITRQGCPTHDLLVNSR